MERGLASKMLSSSKILEIVSELFFIIRIWAFLTIWARSELTKPLTALAINLSYSSVIPYKMFKCDFKIWNLSKSDGMSILMSKSSLPPRLTDLSMSESLFVVAIINEFPSKESNSLRNP